MIEAGKHTLSNNGPAASDDGLESEFERSKDGGDWTRERDLCQSTPVNSNGFEIPGIPAVWELLVDYPQPKAEQVTGVDFS